VAEDRRHVAFLAFAQKALGVPASYSKDELEQFAQIARTASPLLADVIEGYIRIAQLTNTNVEPVRPEIPPAPKNPDKASPGRAMHLFDMLRQKQLFPTNADLAKFAASILPNMSRESRERFRKVSRSEIAARIIDYLETLDPGTRDALERSMRGAMTRGTSRPADRRDFLSTWERIIKGMKF
jgi:hypothetical protein